MNNYQLKSILECFDEIKNTVDSSTRWSLRHPKSPIIGIAIPLEVLMKDRAFSMIYNNFKDFVSQPVVFRFDPYTHYDWHIDRTRGTSLNLLLDIVPSYTMFKKDSRGIKGLDMMYYYDIIKYEEKKFNLLDVRKEHSVINFDQTRHLLSIGIMKSFNEISEFCQANNL